MSEDVATADAQPSDPAVADASTDGAGPTVARAETVERKRLPYLPALDGIRGIGVLVVIFWHAHVSWLTDGALFVLETFFVLSGFLITSLFMVERHNTAGISLKRFWHRRARRLLPAFVPLFLIVTLYAAWTAKATELNRIRGDGITTATYVSNWWFIFSGQSYFEGFSAPSPFRHTWSLSVEEQFYLLIAVVVYFAFRKWGAYRKAYLWVALGGAIASAAWMAILARFGALVRDGYLPLGIDYETWPQWLQTFFNFQSTGDVSRLYYGTDTRLQGSLVGVATAFLVARLDLHRIKRSTYEILAVIGIGGQIFGWLAIQGTGLDWFYYGGFFLWDLIVACSILAMMSPHPTTLGRGLSWKPLVWLGGLSYSIYVLHWPIYVWTDAVLSTSVSFVPLTIIKLALTMVVAYLSFRFFENPIRFKGLPGSRRKIAMAVGVVALAIAFLFASTVGSQSGEDALAAVKNDDGRYPVMIAGDSMAQVMWVHLNTSQADAAAGIAVYPSTLMGCGILEGDAYISGHPTPHNATCSTWKDLWSTNVAKIKPTVTVAMAWGWDIYDRRYTDANGEFVDVPLGSDQWNQLEGDAIQQAIDILSSQGGKVLVVNMPCIDEDAATPQHPTNREVYEPHRLAAINALLAEKVRQNPDKAALFDLNALMCPDGETFRSHVDGNLTSDDGFHFTEFGAVWVWSQMVPQIYELMGVDPPPGVTAAAGG